MELRASEGRQLSVERKSFRTTKARGMRRVGVGAPPDEAQSTNISSPQGSTQLRDGLIGRGTHPTRPGPAYRGLRCNVGKLTATSEVRTVNGRFPAW
jgi:hypothetical protein